MQALGVFSFFLCVVTMTSVYYLWSNIAKISFMLSLITLLLSLFISLVEIVKSMNALELELSDMEVIDSDDMFGGIWKK